MILSTFFFCTLLFLLFFYTFLFQSRYLLPRRFYPSYVRLVKRDTCTIDVFRMPLHPSESENVRTETFRPESDISTRIS